MKRSHFYRRLPALRGALLVACVFAATCGALLAGPPVIDEITIYRGDEPEPELVLRPQPGVTVIKWRYSDGRLGFHPAIADPATAPATAPAPILAATLAEAQAAVAEGAHIRIVGHLRGDASLVIDKPNVRIGGLPGAIIESTNTRSSYPSCIQVTADGVTIEDLELRGPGATIGVDVPSGVNRLTLARLTAPPMQLGQGVRISSATDFAMTECKFPSLVRYGVYASKLTRAKIVGCSFGPSNGLALYNGRKINGEHNVRIEQYEDVEVRDCAMEEREKSTLNAKRGNRLLVTGCTFDGNVGLGPLGDGDGLKHLTDPTQRAHGIEIRGNKVRGRITLEMGVVDALIEANTIDAGTKTAIDVVNDPDYAGHRPVATATIRRNTWSGSDLVNRSGLTLDNNQKAVTN